jgi:hypothetical protein
MTPIDLIYFGAGALALGFIFHGATDWFSRDARFLRKRRRNHGRIASKTRRPTILLSVRTKKAGG